MILGEAGSGRLRQIAACGDVPQRRRRAGPDNRRHHGTAVIRAAAGSGGRGGAPFPESS